MSQIEPELTTGSLPTLKTKYKNETTEQKRARSKRYKEAHQKYDIAYKAFITDLTLKVSAYRRTALKSVEAKDHDRELQHLETLFV